MTEDRNTKAILDEREKTHGPYSLHAEATQMLKNVTYAALHQRRGLGKPELSHMMRETIDMIMHKVGRIIAGDPTEKDHWADIAGYCQLVVRALDAEQVKPIFAPEEHVHQSVFDPANPPEPNPVDEMLDKLKAEQEKPIEGGPKF